ncbi:hypothetical protein [Pseudomonas japonica]|uniref:Uncharacterized protein n=1 Tax=Pseudomonas japonica TaxID=256466 RepID=A0A239B865_9PSED|nr:hypothetical protein [Pseudomonas japonica]SNS03959.1 hypothetical protein SAMN05444352_102369 [Pseudomonas japonica]
MNFIKNGSFESGQLAPWVVDFGDADKVVIADNHAVLLPVGTQIRQAIDPAEIGDLETLVFRVRARAAMVESAEVLKVRSRFRFGIRCFYSTQPGGTVLDFDASGGLQSFQAHDQLITSVPLVAMEVICWVLPNPASPEHDLRDIWFTGFELMSGAHIP